jgi:glycerol kinase
MRSYGRTPNRKACSDLLSGYKELFQQNRAPNNTYFSGPKIKWLIENTNEIKQGIKKDQVLFGNIDSWLIWNLTGGINGGIHYTDVTNASRTMLMNLGTLTWDDELLEILNIPREILPEIKPSISHFGEMKWNNCKFRSQVS